MLEVERLGDDIWPDRTVSDSFASRHRRWKTGNDGDGKVKGDES